MKKLISLVLALTMLLTLTACGSSAPAATEAPAETGEKKTVKSSTLNVREEPGAKKKQIGTYNKGDVITIYEKKKVGSQYWGRTDKGWVCMDFVK